MKAIGYVRVSTEAQAGDDKYGIDVQKNAIIDYADANGFDLVGWRIDEISGAKDDRPGFNEILYEIDDIDAVIVFKNDRVARDTKLYFYYLYTLEKKNVKLLSTKEEFAEGDDFANIYRALLQFVAEQERKNINLRTSKGRGNKAKTGGYSGGRAAYGYSVNHGCLEIVPYEAEIVHMIYRLHNVGNNMLSIAEFLNDKGYRTRKGGRFYASNIKSILENEKLYRGYYKYGEMEWVKGIHEAILD